MSKLVENLFLKTTVSALPGEIFLSPSVAMGDSNAAMFEVWLVSHVNLISGSSPYGLTALLEASNDGLYWTAVPSFPKFEENAASSQLLYEPIQDTSIIIPQAYVRLKFIIVAASTFTASALLHADIRTYRAS
jgi:hypothetical protein